MSTGRETWLWQLLSLARDEMREEEWGHLCTWEELVTIARDYGRSAVLVPRAREFAPLRERWAEQGQDTSWLRPGQ